MGENLSLITEVKNKSLFNESVVNNKIKQNYRNTMVIPIPKNALFLLSISIIASLILIIDSVGLVVANQSVSIVIPRGAANPEVDITKLTPTQWYIPSKISVNQNDTVMWINKDTEIHTVTSGTGAGLESLLNNKRGTKNDIFDSGIFKPGQNWTHKFEKAGVFAYFCTVHPWMEGIVQVKKTSSLPIPSYPVDAAGQRQSDFPVHTLTVDKKYDIDMAWSPKTILTGNKETFILDFSDPPTSKRLHLIPYQFVILQNGKELLRKTGLTQLRSEVQEFVFSKPGRERGYSLWSTAK